MEKIFAPDEEWLTYIARMWLLGSQLSARYVGETMDGSVGDLGRLQRILDGKFIHLGNTQELQSLGIIFGKVFVNETPHYDWWIIEDEYGKDACVRYKETSLLTFPQSMISKRIEAGEEVDVLELYDGLGQLLEETRTENYLGA